MKKKKWVADHPILAKGWLSHLPWLIWGWPSHPMSFGEKDPPYFLWNEEEPVPYKIRVL